MITEDFATIVTTFDPNQVSVDHPAAAGPPSDPQPQPASREYYLDEDECPLAILMNHHPARGALAQHDLTLKHNLREKRSIIWVVQVHAAAHALSQYNWNPISKALNLSPFLFSKLFLIHAKLC